MTKLFLLTLLSLFATNARAEFSLSKIAKLNTLYLEAEKAAGTNRDVYSQENRQGSLNLHMEQRMAEIGFARTWIYSTIGTRQFTHVGLESELGVSKYGLEIYLRHRSDHLLDKTGEEKYPNVNGVGIRLILEEK